VEGGEGGVQSQGRQAGLAAQVVAGGPMIRGGRVEAAAAVAAVGRTAVRQQEPLATGDGNARTGGSWNVVQGRRRDAPGRWSAEEEEVDRDGRSTGEGGDWGGSGKGPVLL
jgi:hypothetical protein